MDADGEDLSGLEGLSSVASAGALEAELISTAEAAAAEAQTRDLRLALQGQIQELRSVRRRQPDQEAHLRELEKRLEALDSPQAESAAPARPLDILSAETDRKELRLGDLTPFELARRDREAQDKDGDLFDDEAPSDDDDIQVLEDLGPSCSTAPSRSPKKLKREAASESEYEPSEDEEAPAKVDRRKSAASTTPKAKETEAEESVDTGEIRRSLTARVRDDGCDRAFQRRLAARRKAKAAEQLRRLEAGEEADEEETFHDLSAGLRVPQSIWARLFKYQRTGVRWLWELDRQGVGGILGDEMGLGKTVQVVAFLAALSVSKPGREGREGGGGLGPVLIVCPATVMSQWVREFHRWWPDFRVALLHSSGSHSGKRGRLLLKMTTWATAAGRGSIVVTSYAGLGQDAHLLQSQPWHYVIFDEGHKLRNPDAKMTLAGKSLKTPHRLILSGSPMQNSLKELWSLFDLVHPGLLGTLPVFLEQFLVPITQGGYANASNVQVETAYRCACLLRDTINPYLLRRLKADVGEALKLPGKSEQVLFCRLTSDQRGLYQEYLASRQCERILSGGMEAFVGLIMLRKLCNHPDLLTGGPNRLGDGDEATQPDLAYGHYKRSGKMAVLHSLLKMWSRQKHKVLLFSQSKQMLDILEVFLNRQRYSFLRMDGSTAIGSRQGLVGRFNESPEIFVFLLTTRVGGLGVNLTGADRVLIYDPDWNPSTDLQARERAWRIGQDRPVTIYRLLTSGTIEEKIYHRQIFKQFLTNRVLADPKQRRFFKTNDLHDLFTLKDEEEAGDGEEGKEKSETAALFAGTGSEVDLLKVARKSHRAKQSSSNYFDAVEADSPPAKRTKSSEKTEEDAGPSREAEDEEDELGFLPKERRAQLREMARRLASRPTAIGRSKEDKAKAKKSSKASGAQVEGHRIGGLVKKRRYKAPPTSELGADSSQRPEDISKSQDDAVLAALFKKARVHTALRHDRIVDSSRSDYVLVEGEARRTADDAAKAIAQSRKEVRRQSRLGEPTWTGRHGKRLRFGPRPTIVQKTKPAKPERKPQGLESLFSGSGLLRTSGRASPDASPGPSTSSGAPADGSSASLLAAIRQRGALEDVEEDDDHNPSVTVEPNPRELLRQLDPETPSTGMEALGRELRKFLGLRDGAAGSEEILGAFGERLKDLALRPIHLRTMLGTIAVMRKSPGDKQAVWRLKEEFH